MHPGDDRRPDVDRGRGRDHAAQVHLVRAQAAGRPARAHDLSGYWRLIDAMKVLVADKFETSGLEGLRAAGLRGGLRAGPEGRRAAARRFATSGADVLVVRGTKVTAAMLDAGRLSPRRSRRRRLQHDRRRGRVDARHLRVQLSRQERHRRRGAGVRPDARARSPHPRQRRGAARRASGTRRSTRRRRASTAGRSGCSASAASAVK